MKILNIIVLAFAAVFFISFAGCEKKGGANPSEPEKPTLPTVPTVPKSPGQELRTSFPVSLVSPQLKVEFKYATNSNLMTEIKQSNGTRVSISYDDKNYPKEYRRFSKDELMYEVSYTTDQQGKVTKGTQYDVESGGKVLILKGKYQISYNDKELISEVKWYDFTNKIIASRQYIYDEKQYLTSKRTIEGTAANMTYSYDDKSGIFKGASYIQLLSIENEGFYLLNSLSNVSSIQNTEHAADNLKVVSQYNSDNQVSTITITDSGSQNKVYKVTYR